MFLLHYTCSVLHSRNSRKAFKFLSERLVFLLYGYQHRNLKSMFCTQNNVFVVDEESREWGIVPFCLPGGGE